MNVSNQQIQAAIDNALENCGSVMRALAALETVRPEDSRADLLKDILDWVKTDLDRVKETLKASGKEFTTLVVGLEASQQAAKEQEELEELAKPTACWPR